MSNRLQSSLIYLVYVMGSGKMHSVILFAVYINKLLCLLKSSQLGCHIDNVFVGAFLLADDILLFAASRAGLQSLIDICHKAAVKSLRFGTNQYSSKSKTKCIVFAKKITTIRIGSFLYCWMV